MRFASVFLVILLIAGCGGSNSGPRLNITPYDLTIEPSSPVPGGEVQLALTNNTTQPVGYNLCTAALAREVGNEWEPVPADRVCTMELRTLDPGESASFRITLPPDLPGGVYRFETNVELLSEGTREEVATTVFLVSESPP